jgi:maleylacetate reductase
MTPAWVFDSLENRVLFGSGMASEAADELARLGAHRVLLLASKGTIQRNRALVEGLGDRIVAQFDRVEPHCPIETIEAGVTAYRSTKADGVLTIGGGSTIGIAKSLRLHTGGPSLVLPTTYSGSEMTPIYGAKSDGQKRTGRDARAKPQVVIYDPELTFSLPVSETAQTGLNCLAHCLEAYYPQIPNPLASQMATQGIEALFAGLPASVNNPQDRTGRTRALYGAFIGGYLVQLVGIRLHHRICHILGGRYDIAHGVSNSVVLPYVAAFNEEVILTAAADLPVRLGAPPAKSIQRLARQIGAPLNLRDQGVPRAALREIAAEVLSTRPFNPRPISPPELERLLECAWLGEVI